MSLAHETIGRGPDLVLLHGWGMNAGVWAPVLDALRADWRVTLIELPGHGRSTAGPRTGGLGEWAEACAEVAPRHAAWLGWSLGGLIAQWQALNNPERVEGLIQVSSSPCFVTREDWPCAMDGEVFRGFAAQLATDSVRTLERFLALQVRGAQAERDTLRQLKAALRERPAAQAEALDAGLEILLETDLREQLSSLQTPSLWLFGGKDALVPARASEGVERLLPQAERRLLPRAGHAPFLSHPEQCIDWLQAFREHVHV